MSASETEGPRWSLHVDLAITRRKIYHTVTDPKGAVMFSSRFVTECMAYLENEDVEAYDLAPSPARAMGVRLGRYETRKL